MLKDVQTIALSGKTCWLLPVTGNMDPSFTVVIPAGDGFIYSLQALQKNIGPAVRSGACKPLTLAAFSSEDWNRAYSPWPAPGLNNRSTDFAGEAPITLEWLLDAFLPEIQKTYRCANDPSQRALLGFSLAGLFSLWTLYGCSAFAHIGSCSGSLWFDGWTDFIDAHTPSTYSRVYLSLGRTENKARNPRISTVGDATRYTADALKNSPSVKESILEINDGGHFNDMIGRLSRAIRWLART